MEKWKQVEEIPRLEVSTEGNVRCFKTKRVWYTRTDKIGYTVGQYSDNGRRVCFKVHRLVAKTFLESDPDRNEVNHINGDKSDNRLSNLEWLNRQENVKHSFEMGLNIPRKGSLNGQAKLDETIVKEICEFYQASVENTPTIAVSVFNISIQQATKIRAKISWKHITQNYNFVPLKNRSKSNDYPEKE